MRSIPGVALLAALATLVAAALRLYGLGEQVVLDDEWHAIHKLQQSGYAGILASFGLADHSIPLTLLYKAMASTVGLAEGRLRALQVACGVALVPAAALLAWRATRDGPATVLLAFALAAAPFLTLYSRIARPYAITTLLAVAVAAALWRWRATRSWRLGAAIAALASLSAWLHPISGVFVAAACLFILAEDLARGPGARAPALRSLGLGIAIASAMALPLAWPLANDLASIGAKTGGNHASAFTLWRMLSIFFGGLPEPVTAVVALAAAGGAIVVARRDPRLGAYLAVLATLPLVVVAVVGAHWSQQGHTFARYVFPSQVILIFWACVGILAAARGLARGREPVAWITCAVAVAGYVYLTPTLRQVTTLGAWYGHIYHHYDYVARYNFARHQYDGYAIPALFHELGRMQKGSAPVIEAPFTYMAPANPFAYFDEVHPQPAKAGLLRGVCLPDEREGEPPPRDRRFRFRSLVPLEDTDGVRASGARFLVLFRLQRRGVPFTENERCIEALARLYGPPARIDALHAVWDLRPEGARAGAARAIQ